MANDGHALGGVPPRQAMPPQQSRPPQPIGLYGEAGVQPHPFSDPAMAPQPMQPMAPISPMQPMQPMAGVAEIAPEPPAFPGMIASYTGAKLTTYASGYSRQILMRVISLVISVVFFLVFRFLFDVKDYSWFFWVMVASIVWALIRLIVTVIQRWRIVRTGVKLPEGPAVQIVPEGVVINNTPSGTPITWADLHSIRGRNHSLAPWTTLLVEWGPQNIPTRFGKLPLVAPFKRATWEVPLVSLDMSAQDLDGALRAFSLGKFGLDLTKTDKIW